MVFSAEELKDDKESFKLVTSYIDWKVFGPLSLGVEASILLDYLVGGTNIFLVSLKNRMGGALVDIPGFVKFSGLKDKSEKYISRLVKKSLKILDRENIIDYYRLDNRMLFARFTTEFRNVALGSSITGPEPDDEFPRSNVNNSEIIIEYINLCREFIESTGFSEEKENRLQDLKRTMKKRYEDVKNERSKDE